MSRKSAPPRRASSDTGRTCAERGRSERTCVRAEPRAQGRRAAEGEVAARHQTRHGTAHRFPTAARRTVTARARGRKRARRRGGDAGRPRGDGPRRRARGARDEAPGQTRREPGHAHARNGAWTAITTAGRDPNGTRARPFRTGPRGEGRPLAPNTQRRRSGGAAAGTERRAAADPGGDTRPRGAAPVTASGKAFETEETRRGDRPRGSEARGGGGGAAATA